MILKVTLKLGLSSLKMNQEWNKEPLLRKYLITVNIAILVIIEPLINFSNSKNIKPFLIDLTLLFITLMAMRWKEINSNHSFLRMIFYSKYYLSWESQGYNSNNRMLRLLMPWINWLHLSPRWLLLPPRWWMLLKTWSLVWMWWPLLRTRCSLLYR